MKVVTHGRLKMKSVNTNVVAGCKKISCSDTDGDLAITEQTSVSPGKGVPLHVHPLG
ncbi:MAG: hypothetical protein IPN56_15940 [Chitinophagaceae bacterium]|nr:hypothetical protein [Chitinophagaceae bacterium]